MKKIFLILVFLFLFAGFSAAQEEDASPEQNKQARRPNLLRELGLTQEQVQQIRQLNSENREKLREAQIRVREAARNLDQAVYADVLDEELLKTRLRNLQEAQAELTKLRSAAELAVRKVLTAEQLIRFRELREKFMQMRRNPQNKQFEPQNQQQRRFPNRRSNRRENSPAQ